MRKDIVYVDNLSSIVEGTYKNVTIYLYENANNVFEHASLRAVLLMHCARDSTMNFKSIHT